MSKEVELVASFLDREALKLTDDAAGAVFSLANDIRNGAHIVGTEICGRTLEDILQEAYDRGYEAAAYHAVDTQGL